MPAPLCQPCEFRDIISHNDAKPSGVAPVEDRPDTAKGAWGSDKVLTRGSGPHTVAAARHSRGCVFAGRAIVGHGDLKVE